jgi:hypothetical protein
MVKLGRKLDVLVERNLDVLMPNQLSKTVGDGPEAVSAAAKGHEGNDPE